MANNTTNIWTGGYQSTPELCWGNKGLRKSYFLLFVLLCLSSEVVTSHSFFLVLLGTIKGYPVLSNHLLFATAGGSDVGPPPPEGKKYSLSRQGHHSVPLPRLAVFTFINVCFPRQRATRDDAHTLLETEAVDLFPH